MAYELIHIPFVSGTREDIDEKLLPAGTFKSATDCRLRLTGKLGPRRRFSALTSDTQPVSPESGGSPAVAPVFRASQVVESNGKLLALGTKGTVSGSTPSEPTPRPRSIASWNEAGFWSTQSTETEGGAVYKHTSVRRLMTFPPVTRTLSPRIRVSANSGYIGITRTIESGVSELIVADAATGTIVADRRQASPGHGATVLALEDGRIVFFAYNSVTSQLGYLMFNPSQGFSSSAMQVLLTAGMAVPINGGVEAVRTPTGIAIAVTSIVPSATDTSTIIHASVGATTLTTIWSSTIASSKLVRICCSDTNIFWAYNTATQMLVRRDTLAAATATTSAGTSIVNTVPVAPVMSVALDKLFVVYQPISGEVWRATWNFPNSSLGSPAETLRLDVVACASGCWLDELGNPQILMRARSVSSSLALSSSAFIGARGVYYSSVVAPPHQGYSFMIELGNLSPQGDVPPVSQVGSNVYGAVYLSDELSASASSTYLSIYTWKVNAPEDDWRSTAKLASTLYFAGGAMQQFDGSRLVESGFQLKPNLAWNSNTGSGNITAGTRQYILRYRWRDHRGDVHESQTSSPVQAIAATSVSSNLLSTAPRSERSVLRQNSSFYGDVEVALYRTKAAPDEVFRRVPGEFLTVVFDSINPYGSVSINDNCPDTSLDDAEFLDTTLIESPPAAPGPCIATWAGRDRLFAINDEGYQVSHKLEPGKTVQWSNLSAFSGRVEGRPRAIWSLDDMIVIATDDQLWALAGEGPDRVGNGGFGAPTRIPGAVGCLGQQTVVQDSLGVWFVDTSGKLYHHSRGSAPVWRGEPVRETLSAFPIVVGAAVCRRENTVNWLLRDEAGTPRMVVYDTRADCWYTDTLDEIGLNPTSLCSWGDRLALTADGVVYTQDNADHTDGSKYRFSIVVSPAGVDGWCSLARYALTGTSKAGTTVTSSIRYTDDTSAELGAGHTETLSGGIRDNGYEWGPRRRKDARFELSFNVEGYPEPYEATALTLQVMPIRGARRKPKDKRR